MSLPEFDDIRDYVATLDAAEVLAYLPCIISDLVNTGIEATRLNDPSPDPAAALRAHSAFLGAVLAIMHKRVVEHAGVTPDHARCGDFVQMLNQTKLRITISVHRHQHGGDT